MLNSTSNLLIRFSIILYLIKVTFTRPALKSKNDVTKFPIDLNKTPEENIDIIANQKNDFKMQGKRKREPVQSEESTQTRSKKNKYSLEAFLDDNGECIVHRPHCSHWNGLQLSEKQKSHLKFHRMMRSPEQKKEDSVKALRYHQNPKDNAIRSKRWYVKHKPRMSEEQLKERRRKNLIATRRFKENKRLGLPSKKYASRTKQDGNDVE